MMKKKEKDKEEKNPYHKKYSLLSNISYLVKSVARYQPKIIFLVILGMVTEPVMQYL